jgi:hypothetical protein
MRLRLYRRTGLFVPGLFRQRVGDCTSTPLKEQHLDSSDEQAMARIVEDAIDEALRSDDPHRPRALLVHAPRGGCWLILVISHVIADGWSVQILRRELSILYMAYLKGDDSPLPLRSESYGEFAIGQHAQIASGELDNAARHWLRQWTERADGAIRHRDLPFARLEPAQPVIRRRVQALTDVESSAVLGLARRLRTTPYVVARTALTIVLHAYTGKSSVALWANYANRDTVPEGLVGHCANTHLVTTVIDPGSSCWTLARQVADTLLEGQVHQALPVMALWRHTGRNLAARCDCRINVDYVREPRAPDASVLQPAVIAGGRRWMDLDLRLRQGWDGLALQATYDSSRFADQGISDLLASARRVFSRWLTNDNALVASCASFVR